VRILYVTASYLPESVGGVELHVAGLCRQLRARGHEVAVVTRTARADVPHLGVVRDEVDGVPVTRIGNTFEDATELRRLYAHEGIADLVDEEVAARAPDLLHVHHLTCLSTLVPARTAARGVPVVMTLHDFWMGCPRGQRITAGLDPCPTIRLGKCIPCLRELWPHLLGRGSAGPDVPAAERDAADREQLEAYHAAMRGALSSCAALVTPSHFVKRMYEAYGLPAASIRVVENGIPVGWERPHEPAAGVLRVGYAGSVIPSKGVHVLLEAVRALGDPSRYRVEVHGAVLPWHNDRTYGQRLAALREGHESSIRLAGPYGPHELPGILARLDVLVVPSLWYEAYGLTVREAFCAGVPVVASDHGALAEAIEHGRTGLLVPAGDAAALAAALRRLADDPPLRRRLAAAARARVRDEREAADEMLALYGELVPGAAR